MFFKSMEIHGFKSFPDKTILDFDTKMTAVVGSNGNGKSNISDALRWVMGEQGAKTLRGDKMEDVIFYGTTTRKQMGFAKVALCIDNTDRALNIDNDEVTITRKLYRSGESEYLINGAKTRLKDVHELLMGTGLGRDGYSIIGQGRVAEIVNSKGSKRREIFEEAAGVSKFLHQKAETETKLKQATDNILRLKDIALELEERLPILEKQAEKAKKARVLVTEEKKLEISVSVSELEQITKDLAQIEDKILLDKGECEHFDRDIEKLENEDEEISQEKMSLQQKMENLRQAGQSARDKIAAIQAEIAVKENDIEHNNQRVVQIRQQIENSKTNAEEFDKQIAEIEKQISEKQQALDENKKLVEEYSKQLTGMSAQNEILDKEYRELDEKQGQLYLKKSECSLTISQAERNCSDLAQRLEEIVNNSENQDAVIADYRAKQRDYKAQLEAISNEKQEAENKLSGYNRLFSSKSEKLENSKKEQENLKRNFEQKKSRHDVLVNIDQNMSGFGASVKSVMGAFKVGKLSNIHGTTADIIQVNPKYTTAIETALGSALQNIIVDNEEAAKRCIRYLKDTNGGRATFLPLTSVRGRALEINGLVDEDGFEGMGYELVSYDEKYDGIIKSVLGKTAVVDDIDTATFLAKKYGYKFRIITLDGQVINAGGSFTGGSTRNDAGIIARKQEIEALKTEIQSLSDTIYLSSGSFKNLQAEVAKMAMEMDGFKEQIQKCSTEEIRLTAELGGVDNLIKQCAEQQENSEIVIDRQKVQIAQEKAVIEKYTLQLGEINKQIELNQQNLDKSGSEKQSADHSRKQLSESISELNISCINQHKDIENFNLQISNLKFNKANIDKGNDGLNGEVEQLVADNEKIEAEILEKQEQKKVIAQSFNNHESGIDKIIADTNRIEQRISQIRKEVKELSEHKEKFSRDLARQEERQSAAQNQNDKLINALWENHEITLTEAKVQAVPVENMLMAKNELANLKRSITALGNVNYGAIDELEEVSSRYKIMSEQLTDIENSKRDLEKLISELTVKIKNQFLQSFTEINRHFGRLFKEIFGGGDAKLELSNPDDVLNSEIEIAAAPPGKVIKNLSLLSGGETSMIALTIYLAILVHRPTPFCMLDEVDAALDDANVEKYATYLKKFSDNTQLMVITHRRGTIEFCDVLYGVFMQEKGVSRLLKQEIFDDLDIELK